MLRQRTERPDGELDVRVVTDDGQEIATSSEERSQRIFRAHGLIPACRPRLAAPRTRLARHRGARRPRAHAARSSAKSGDSGDDGPGEPPPPPVELRRHPQWGACTPSLIRTLEQAS